MFRSPFCHLMNNHRAWCGCHICLNRDAGLFLINYWAGRHCDILLPLTKSSDKRISFCPEITPFFSPSSIRGAAVSRRAATAVSAVTRGSSQPRGRCCKGQNCWEMNNVSLLRDVCIFFICSWHKLPPLGITFKLLRSSIWNMCVVSAAQTLRQAAKKAERHRGVGEPMTSS